MNLSEMTIHELNQLKLDVEHTYSEKTYQNNVNRIKENEQYVGRCFLDGDRYLMVVSSKSSNPYNLECLCFNKHIRYTEASAATAPFKIINFPGLYISDEPLLRSSSFMKPELTIMDTYNEIDKGAFYEAMYDYIKELQRKIESGYFETNRNIEKVI